MARKKVRYTKDEITNNLYTTGSEWMTTDYAEYIGLYHRYTTGEVYTLSKWNSQKSVELIPFKELSKTSQRYRLIKEDIKTLYQPIQPYFLETSEKDIITGYITRYFAYDIVNNVVLEIDNDTYKKIQQKEIDPNVYQIVSLRWYITGDLEDVTSGIGRDGVKTKNKKEIQAASKTISLLSTYLTDLSEFYSDTTYIIPDDINQLQDSDFLNIQIQSFKSS